MSIEKAIARLDSLREPGIEIFDCHDIYALTLGMEALKAWKEHRGKGSLTDPLLLPGEIEEEPAEAISHDSS